MKLIVNVDKGLRSSLQESCMELSSTVRPAQARKITARARRTFTGDTGTWR